MSRKTMDDFMKDNPQGKHVFVRSDLNVPLGDNQSVEDDTRIKASLPLLEQLKNSGAKVVLMAHLGRPENAQDTKYSLKPVADKLNELGNLNVTLANDITGKDSKNKVSAMKNGDIVLLENIRFDPSETSKDDSQRQKFAQDIINLAGDNDKSYVDDAFGAVHRKHASVYDVPRQLDKVYSGPLVESELEALQSLINGPQTPYTVVLGGSKVSDKINVIENLMKEADYILIGGAMAFTFLKARGYDVGSSLVEDDYIDTVNQYMDKAQDYGCEFILPADIVMAKEFSANAEAVTTPADAMEDTPFGKDGMGLDIGKASGQLFGDQIKESGTVFWNGPMGVFEMRRFSLGTEAIAKAMEYATANGAYTVVGGGDSVAAIHKLHIPDDKFSHVSTGGGASLEYLEGKKLPGIDILDSDSSASTSTG